MNTLDLFSIPELDHIPIQTILDIAFLAGERALEIYHQPFDITLKEDHSPLTQADLEANRIITEGLRTIASFPILSEEQKEIDYSERKNWEFFWLVDPIDGTKEFIKKNHEFTINIALIHIQRPILGIIYAPALYELYFGHISHGAYKLTAEQELFSLPITKPTQNKNLRIAASRSHPSKEFEDYLSTKEPGSYKIITTGSSLKFCFVAEGRADIYPRLGPTREWDTAAGHAIINSVGKHVFHWDTQTELTYNKPNLKNDYFLVT